MTDAASARSTAAEASGIYDPRYVRGLFDRMSRSYERMNYVMSFGFSARWRRQMMQLVDRPDEASDVIDLTSVVLGIPNAEAAQLILSLQSSLNFGV
ncbi:class I SAM-dependent methyltransferase [Agromyces sp. ISL-38]|uniref:class I SAM-dependent methyltransferase n=1 Tax=Agromyces sp. ISL-38 TaxID=2819107 RepID=UPI001BEAA5BD|nr:class I SAM-dependent methyltransferase [Agromyces sp. ISL-38]MBT2498856.1 class I SAM-dependent methyltransferase [Agromyces sp. ISL-38]MBT2516459.1 class I SAM-dependent methyltransferase [Streptomyces sp. ISL-90]